MGKVLTGPCVLRVNRGIGPARQSAALDLEAAFKALDDRSCAPVCDRGPGASKFDRGWLLLDAEGIGKQLCEGLPFGGGLGSLLGGLDAPSFENRCQGFGQGATLGVRVLW